VITVQNARQKESGEKGLEAHQSNELETPPENTSTAN